MKRPALSELSLTEKIAQLLMLSDEAIQYKTVDNEKVIRPKEEIDEILQRCQYGSYWHTGSVKMGIVNLAEEWSTAKRMTLEESKEYIDSLQKNVRLPMLVAMDAENGLGYALSSGTIIPTPISIGAADDEELTAKLHTGVSRELKAAGANWRWAPIIDIHGRLSASVLRGFSDNVEQITKIATAAIRAVEKEHVATTVKHFPGSDGYDGIRDSHFSLSCNMSSFEDWKKGQGKVFQNMIDAGVMTIMVGHSSFPAVDDTKINGNYTPSSASKKVITGLLREEMGFEGVIITDAIEMAGLSSVCSSYEDVLVRTINAGNDILLGVRPEAMDIVYKAVEDGKIPMERIDESCERVLDLKEKIGLFDDEIRNEVIDIPEANRMTEEASREISEKALTLLYDRNNIIPVNKDKIKRVTIIYASHYNGTGEQLNVMKEEFEKRGATVNLYNGLPGGGIDEVDANSDLIIYAGYIASHRPMGLPSLYGNQIAMFLRAFSKGKEKSIGISLGYPYIHFDVMGGADTFVNAYSPDPEALRAFVKGVYGEIEFVGKSPIDIEPKIRKIYC